ncbi:MAG: type VI secretion system tip protein TssI/VgrG [Thermoanaerobaculia bacterium]
MSTYTQANRPMAITTPLGPDVLLLTALKGHEGISELFRFELEVMAEQTTTIAFDQILGQGVTVELELPEGGKRYINGIVCRFRQGRRDGTFTHYRAEVVPKLWLLTRKVRSRIFQQLTVPEILAKVFAGLVVKIEVSAAYEPRDYCTQYRESDFAFASRLMEEEGIRYYFRHSDGSHQLVVTDDALEHPDVPGESEVVYEELDRGGDLDEMRVTGWEKAQEIRSDTWTLRDHSFELPGQALEAQQRILDSVPVGEVTHKLRVVDQPLELYDFPGGYAQRFDGVDPQGAPRPSDLQKIFPDRERTVRIRMEAEEMLAVAVDGRSYCRHFSAGFAFSLSKHFDADGRYVIARVEHEASLDGDYRTGGTLPFTYRNAFRAIPAALAYRPPRTTPKPVISGNQTATVVAPPGEEIWCDKYGRVKVLFHWDREGKRDLTASCWIRVAQPWAGNGWGTFFWPRAGNEVVVSFEEGDPDQPLVVGSVYNAENMPFFPLPLRNEVAGIKSASVRGYANQHYNGIVFYDQKGAEHLSIHSERTLDLNSEWDKEFHAGRNRHDCVGGVSIAKIGGIPSGGGGGGGEDDPGDKQPPDHPDGRRDPPGGGGDDDDGDDDGDGGGGEEYEPFDKALVTELGVKGLDAKLVLGQEILGVVGLNELLFVGGNIQVNVAPIAMQRLAGPFPCKALDHLMGTGVEGNMVLTVGTNTLLTVGGSNILLKDAKDTEYKIWKHKLTKDLSVIVGAVTIVWAIAYASLKTLEDREILYYVYEPTLLALLAAILLYEGFRDNAQKKLDGNVWVTLYRAFPWMAGKISGGFGSFMRYVDSHGF